jgi:hypothetical protein
MTDNGELCNIEKAIGDSQNRGVSPSAPPFAEIAGRIAAGEPQENFEEFFAGEIVPVQAVRRKKKSNWKLFAGAAAAALVLFIGGGAVLRAMLNGSLYEAESTADDAMYYDRLEDNGQKSIENAAAEDSECLQDKVSDSDLDESDDSLSSDSSR